MPLWSRILENSYAPVRYACESRKLLLHPIQIVFRSPNECIRTLRLYDPLQFVRCAKATLKKYPPPPPRLLCFLLAELKGCLSFRSEMTWNDEEGTDEIQNNCSKPGGDSAGDKRG
jgi:hypothetical protein